MRHNAVAVQPLLAHAGTEKTPPMLTIPIAVYLIGLAFVLKGAFQRTGDAGAPGVRRVALKRVLAWTGIWAALFVIYLLIMALGNFGM